MEHIYYLDGSQILAEEWENRLCIYLYDADGSPMGMQYRTTSMAEGVFYTFWFEKNLQGDVVAVYNNSGVKVLSYNYDAWGNVSGTRHNVSSANRYAEYNPFCYRGYYRDSETGFYYLQSRYYDPQMGRFLNADGYVNANGDILGFNMFAYCGNNPVMGYDPTGEFVITATAVAWLAFGTIVSLVAIVNLPEIVEAVDTVVKSAYESAVETKKAIDDKIKKLNDDHPGEYTVYALQDNDGNIQYVGRTQDLNARLAAHRKSAKTGKLEYAWSVSGLTWSEARGLEQIGIETYCTLNAAKDMAKPGRNWINGISIFNQNRKAYMEAAWDYIYNKATDTYYNITGQ